MLQKLRKELSSLFLNHKTQPSSLLRKSLNPIITITMLIKNSNRFSNRNRRNSNIIITTNNNRMNINNITKRKKYMLKRLKLNHRLNPSTLIQLKHMLLLKLILKNTLQLVSKLKPLKNQRRKLIKSAIILAITAIDLQERVVIIPTKESNRLNTKRAKKVK